MQWRHNAIFYDIIQLNLIIQKVNWMTQCTDSLYLNWKGWPVRWLSVASAASSFLIWFLKRLTGSNPVYRSYNESQYFSGIRFDTGFLRAFHVYKSTNICTKIPWFRVVVATKVDTLTWLIWSMILLCQPFLCFDFEAYVDRQISVPCRSPIHHAAWYMHPGFPQHEELTHSSALTV